MIIEFIKDGVKINGIIYKKLVDIPESIFEDMTDADETDVLDHFMDLEIQ